jgi:hypothetical protein
MKKKVVFCLRINSLWYLCTKRQIAKTIMKRIFLMSILMFICSAAVLAQDKKADMVFDKVLYNFGTFSEKDAVQKCTFTFTNKGNAPLIINQAVASCGCTVPSYTKAPIMPGKKGTISVTYNGSGKFPGHFKKSITIRSNATTEMTRLYIEGVMTEAK